MMDNANTTESCRHSDNIVSYLYDELAASERSTFETHLVDCTSCTDEFAAVADIRFSVYEWHREEFIPLATPQFSIPYEGDRARAGILSVVAELFTFSRPAFAMATIAVVLGIGLIAITLTRSDEQQIAANVEAPALSKETPTQAVLPQPAVTVTTAAPVTSAFTPVKATVKPRTTERATRKPPVNTQRDDQQRQAVRAPVLTDEIDIEDDSLRLTDLFDEVGG